MNAFSILIVRAGADRNADSDDGTNPIQTDAFPLDVTAVASVEEAVAWGEGDREIDAILLDLTFDGTTGLRTIGELQRTFDQTPIVVLTGNEDHELGLEAIGMGAQDYLLKSEVTPQMVARSLRYAVERQDLLREIHYLALHDSLTGLANRRAFVERGEMALKNARRYDLELSIALIDCDTFKAINQKLGYQAGDDALFVVSNYLKGAARETDLVSRLGGEEFAMLMPNTSIDGAAVFAERIRATFDGLVIGTSAGDVSLTVSIGLATVLDSTETLEDMIRDASNSVERAKAAGQNRVDPGNS